MTILFVILVILASVILGFFVLIQNPKGGGLAGSFGGVSSQFMGVKQTNDILERGTWIFAIIIGLLSLLSTFFISGATGDTNNGRLQDVSGAPVQAPAAQPGTPLNTVPLTAPADSAK
ncbi:preprotein translocase subunit SecG [Niabella insulamsoli]|uniref:preprotein translocase subunit SecG n=1 Tax=Niabella insulamsoli TaxID=3144874 RepID=UPI0031FE4123